MTLEELQVIITAKTSGLQSQLNNVNRQLKNMQGVTQRSMNGVQGSINKATNGVAGAMKGLRTTLIALGIGKILKDSFDMARTYEASVQQVNRMFGAYASAMDSWISKNAATFGLARAQAMQYASIYGNLIRGFERDAGKLTAYTQQLLQATTIIASSTGRSVQDVSERIRSGLLGNTEAIEDLGIYANVALLKTTDAFKQLSNGAKWEDLSFQTQQQIRLMSILEQTSKTFGNSIQQNTNYQLMQFTANLKNIQLNIGQAFMPIVSVVLPVLNALALALSNATAWLASFMNTLFGTDFTQGAGAVNQIGVSAGGASNGLGEMADSANDAGNAVKKAGKAAKGALAAFDEINTLAKDSSNDGSGGSGSGAGSGGGATSTPTNTGATPSPVNQKMIDAVEKFKKALQPTIDALARLKKALQPFEKFVWQGLKDFYNLCLKPIGEWILGQGLPRFIDAISKGLETINWERINASLRELYKAITPFALTIGEGLLQFWEKVLVPMGAWTVNEILPRFLSSLATAISIVTEVIKGILGVAGQFFEEFLKPIAEYAEPKILAYFDSFNAKFTELRKQIQSSEAFKDLKVILAEIYKLLLPIAEALAGIGIWFADFRMSQAFIDLKYLLKDIEDRLGFVAAIINGDFGDAWEHFKDLMVDNKIDKAKEKLLLLQDSFGKLKTVVSDFVTAWTKNITDMFNIWNTKISAWWTTNVTPWFTVEKWNTILFNIGVSLGLSMGKFIAFWNMTLPTWWTNNVVPWFTIEKWSAIFTNIKTALSTKWNETSTWWTSSLTTWWSTKVTPWFTVAKWQGLGASMKDGMISGFKGVVNSIADILNNVISNFESMVNKVTNGINKIIDGYNSVASKAGLGTINKKNNVVLGRVPKLARGGIINGATNFGNYIAGEAGKEMIVPLENTPFVDKLASALGNAVMVAMSTGMNTGSTSNERELVLDLDGTRFARAIVPEVVREIRRLGVSI